MSDNERIGFIGLGTMGAPMAWNLQKAGYDLGVYNRTKSKTKSFRDKGLKVYSNPKKLAQESGTIIVMVSDSDALIDVLLGYQGVLSGMQEGATVINMSTVSREATLESADAVKLEGGRFAEAPVSGTKKPAEEGTLTILAAGGKSLIEEYNPLFRALGDTVIYCGEIGKGTDMKLTINLLLGGMMQVFAETLTFGERLGLKMDDILDNIESGPLNASLFQIKGNLIKKQNFEKNFPINLLLKDMNLIIEAAQRNNVYLPAASSVRESINGAKSLGYGEQDMAAVIKLLDEIGG